MTYKEKLRDPRWQRKCAEMKSMAGWACECCNRTDLNLQLHHKYYQSGAEPWDYPASAFLVLCEVCHEQTEDALFNLRQLFADYDFFHINNFVSEFYRAKAVAFSPLDPLNACAYSMGRMAEEMKAATQEVTCA